MNDHEITKHQSRLLTMKNHLAIRKQAISCNNKLCEILEKHKKKAPINTGAFAVE